MPPSAPERTLQASGQGQAIARPQGRPTLLLHACTIYALGGEWREPAAEDKLCVPVPRQAHTRHGRRFGQKVDIGKGLGYGIRNLFWS